jgi:signal transduction histidine kinase
MARLIRRNPWAEDGSHVLASEVMVAQLAEATPVAANNEGDDTGMKSISVASVPARRADARARAEERRKISRLLHDEIGQSLTAVNVKLAVLKAQVKGRLQRELSSAQAMLEKTMEQVQGLSHELHPCMVEDLGLMAALRSHIKNFARESAMAIDLRADARVHETSPELGMAVFRSIQALLGDLMRGGATGAEARNDSTIKLTLAVEADAVRVDAQTRISRPGRAGCDRGEELVPDVSTFHEQVLMAGGTVRFRANRNQAIISARFPTKADP